MSNNTYTAKETSFWKFIQENEIEIPIIQRDYAQGRLGKESLRKNFLADLKKALDNEKPYKDKAMKMDFVYGSVEHEKMNPLDGQQRLTTLWLLHWYIALHAGKLDDEVAKTLNQFTYETRISSREFCDELCKPAHFNDFNGTDIVGFITKQTWFYSAWKQDPTIQSMLRMLGGTKVTDKKGEDIVDGIEELFAGKDTDDFEKYWERLTSDHAPIVFYHLPLKDFGLSDDLYIKMNARGKQLTSFENFKADLVGYITEQSDSELLGDEAKNSWKSLLDERDGIPIKMDTAWTDIFWVNKSNDNRIDEIYFAFINRFFLQELICAGEEDNANYLYSANDLEEKNGTFKFLYGNKSDDSQLQYSGLERYLYQEKSIPNSLFQNLSSTLNNYKPEILNCFPEWVGSKFAFIPQYNEDGQISTLGQKERVVFLAVSKYFEKGEFKDSSFKQWMRVVWNIVENSGIDAISAMIGAMRLINELSEHSHSIYEFLSDSNSKIESVFAKEQIAEEIAKAKQILNEKTRTDGKTWEDIIIEAEKYAFFKGAIRFLFTDEKGQVNDESWGKFDTKWGNAREYFDEAGSGVKDGIDNDKLYKSNALLMKSLLANCDDFWGKIWWHFEFANDATRWKRILISDKWRNAVDVIMGTGVTAETTQKSVEIVTEPLIKNLVDNELMDYVCNNMSGAWIRRTYHDYLAIWQSGYPSSQIVLNPILVQLKNDGTIDYRDNNRIKNCRYYKCVNKNVDFKYNNHPFLWYGYPNEEELDIYLMEDNWAGYKKRQNPTKDKGTKEDTHFCFRVTAETTPESFTKMLDKLIAQVEEDEQSKS